MGRDCVTPPGRPTMFTVKGDAVLNPVTEETAQQKRPKDIRIRYDVLADMDMKVLYKRLEFLNAHSENNDSAQHTAVD